MFIYDNIPNKLKQLVRFCNWKYVERNGKMTKIPINPKTGQPAKTNMPETFSDFNTAFNELQKYNGIGFRVSNGVCALDLDHCFNNDGSLKPLAQNVINVFKGCYIEKSPSGKGLRVIFLVNGFQYNKEKYYINNQALGFEVYVSGATNRFVTITGDVYRDGDLLQMSDELQAVLDKYMKRQASIKHKANTNNSTSYLTDESVITKALQSVQGEKFNVLWNGDMTGYASNSEADLALASILAFWCGGDLEQMERLFRKSGLYREKWDRTQSGSTYGAITLDKAVTNINSFYTPGGIHSTVADDFAKKEIILADLQPENNERYSWTDIGNGRLFADYYKSVARFVFERKIWYCFNGKRWVPDVGTLKVMERCKELADKLLVYALTIKDERRRVAYLEFCRKWQARRNRETILKDAQGVYPISMEEYDSDPYVFNCYNGTLHLKNMEFKPHNSEDKLTKISKVKYDTKARCERFERYIDEIMSSDKEKAHFLQKALGYAISGDTRHECLFILYGSTTRNGKGSLMESVLRVMGDYGRTVRPESISIKQNSSSQTPTEDIARLSGIRFANISEPSRGLVLNAAQVKSMTGNDTLNARFLHENSFDFQPQFKIYINANYLPVITDMTLFSSGRVVIIPFDRHFSKDEQDNTLKKEFAKQNNQSGILNWLVEGYRLLCKEGLTQPDAVKAATESYRHDSDKIMLFVEERLVQSPNGEVRTSEAYSAYQHWCSENGCYSENMRNFKQALAAFARIERKRPKNGGGATTLLIGYNLTASDGTEFL